MVIHAVSCLNEALVTLALEFFLENLEIVVPLLGYCSIPHPYNQQMVGSFAAQNYVLYSRINVLGRPLENHQKYEVCLLEVCLPQVHAQEAISGQQLLPT